MTIKKLLAKVYFSKATKYRLLIKQNSKSIRQGVKHEIIVIVFYILLVVITVSIYFQALHRSKLYTC